MPLLELLYTTGRPHIDRSIAAVVTVFEAAFPGRIRGYYLLGSLSRGTAGPNSDIDLEILFRGTLRPDDHPRLQSLNDGCSALASVPLDLSIFDEDSLTRIDTVALKTASKLVYGDDTRPSIPLPSIETYLHRVSRPVQRALTVEFRTVPVQLPLTYPQPEAEFYGYVPTDPTHPHTVWGTKIWVLNIGWMATFLIAYQTGVMIPTKDDMVRLYRELVNDRWTAFVTEVHDLCRLEWDYVIPTSADDRARLRQLCARTLDYEHHVIGLYHPWLQSELAQGDAALAKERLAAFNFG